MKKIVIIVVAAFAAFAGTQAVSANNSKAESAQVFEKKKNENLKTVVFKSDLHCAKCVKKVEENIAFEKGVKALEVSLEKHTITVTYDVRKTNAETLAAAIRKLGYNAELAK